MCFSRLEIPTRKKNELFYLKLWGCENVFAVSFGDYDVLETKDCDLTFEEFVAFDACQDTMYL